MRLLALAAALLVSLPLCAQVPAKEKKAAAKNKPQATKEQIRRFNELEKKQQKK